MGAHHSIGLLALISGQGLDLENFSLAKAGPLLILMGFVATTLSICDPSGALQKRMPVTMLGNRHSTSGKWRLFLQTLLPSCI